MVKKLPWSEDDPPKARCSFCYRKSWDANSIGNPCEMTQPNSEKCPGVFVPPNAVKDVEANTVQGPMELQGKFDRVISLLKNIRLPHGTCNPRSRKACTNCNSREELDAIVDSWSGARLHLSEHAPKSADASVIPETEKALRRALSRQFPTSLETGGRNALNLQQLADFLEELPAKIDDAQQNECLCGSIQAEFGCPQCSAMSALYREIEEVAHSASQMSDNCDDTARLDWLELNGFQRVDEDTCRQSMHVGLLGITFDKGRNLRDAIDAAIVLQSAQAASDKEHGK